MRHPCLPAEHSCAPENYRKLGLRRLASLNSTEAVQVVTSSMSYVLQRRTAAMNRHCVGMLLILRGANISCCSIVLLAIDCQPDSAGSINS